MDQPTTNSRKTGDADPPESRPGQSRPGLCLARQFPGLEMMVMNARTEAELDVWLGVVSCLSGMRDMSDTQRRRLADRALELMRESEAQRHADVVVDAGPTASPVPVAQALGRGPERFADAGPTDADLRGEVSYGD